MSPDQQPPTPDQLTPTDSKPESAAEAIHHPTDIDQIIPPVNLPDTSAPHIKPQRTAAGGLAFIFSWIIFPLLAVFILHFFIFQAYHVVGTSMLSTLEPNDYLIVSKVGDTWTLIKRDLFRENTNYIPARDQIHRSTLPGGHQPNLCEACYWTTGRSFGDR